MKRLLLLLLIFTSRKTEYVYMQQDMLYRNGTIKPLGKPEQLQLKDSTVIHKISRVKKKVK